MKEETMERLYEISYKSKDRFLTPIIMDYYLMEANEKSEEKVLERLVKKYNNKVTSS